MSDGDWDAVLDTNLNGFYNVLKPIVCPWFRRAAGAHCRAFIGIRLDWQPWTGELQCGEGWHYWRGEKRLPWSSPSATSR